MLFRHLFCRRLSPQEVTERVRQLACQYQFVSSDRPPLACWLAEPFNHEVYAHTCARLPFELQGDRYDVLTVERIVVLTICGIANNLLDNNAG
jgi:hypothetical protein